MPEGRELRARGQRTMRRLLDAGVEVFGLRGYHPARVDDIVKVANTSHGTFYLYFPNKEELFRAIAADVVSEARVLAESLGEIGPDAAGRAELRRWLGEVTVFFEHFGPVIRAWIEADVPRDDQTDIPGELARALEARLPEPLMALALVALIERFHFYVRAGQVAATGDEILDTLDGLTAAALFGGA